MHQILLTAAAVCALTSSVALADDKDKDKGPSNGNGYANGWYKNGKADGGGGSYTPGGGGGNKGAPGPLAGAGLPFLLLAGGYALVRRYRSHKPAE
ncbi:hypothetical protein [Microvirga puerhi]|uniref:Uncharacterized protein n=1 Tax=Microvirga puerhi TaxID=2876078 RepID=A0ABS7VUM6_9HYPH|nr:hypothetical protein [Microvirga puerhi]MBZ6078820.1 hypothetical protein [Microvirga puerhi]